MDELEQELDEENENSFPETRSGKPFSFFLSSYPILYTIPWKEYKLNF